MKYRATKNKYDMILLIIVLLLLAVNVPNALAADKLDVFVSIPPQADFVERIGGSHVNIHVLVPTGQEPHVFEPTPRQMMALGKTDIYFMVGTLPFESRLRKKLLATNPAMKIMDTSRGISFLKQHPDDHGHKHEQSDPHIWLGPPEIKIQARNITDELIKAAPDNAVDFIKNLKTFLNTLDTLDGRIQKTLKKHHSQTVLSFHAAFGYFLRAYGLKQEAVEVNSRRPTPKQLQALIKEARADDVKIIFVQPQFDRRSAETVAQAIGGVVVAMDPLAKDVLANLEDIAVKVEKALGKAQ